MLFHIQFGLIIVNIYNKIISGHKKHLSAASNDFHTEMDSVSNIRCILNSTTNFTFNSSFLLPPDNVLEDAYDIFFKFAFGSAIYMFIASFFIHHRKWFVAPGVFVRSFEDLQESYNLFPRRSFYCRYFNSHDTATYACYMFHYDIH